MSSISTVLFLLIITSVCLFAVNLINQRQTRARIVNQKLTQMKRKVTDLEELSATLEPLVESNRIPIIINEEAISLLQSMLKLSPKNQTCQVALEGAEHRDNELNDPGRSVTIFRLMESDAAMAKAHYSLSEAARIIRKRQAQDHIQAAEAQQLLTDLIWSDFMVKISSHIGQGHKAVTRGETLRASAFYRKALEVASEETHKDERQKEIINEIEEILDNKRTALSPRLMPETLYNPKSAPKKEAS